MPVTAGWGGVAQTDSGLLVTSGMCSPLFRDPCPAPAFGSTNTHEDCCRDLFRMPRCLAIPMRVGGALRAPVGQVTRGRSNHEGGPRPWLRMLRGRRHLPLGADIQKIAEVQCAWCLCPKPIRDNPYNSWHGPCKYRYIRYRYIPYRCIPLPIYISHTHPVLRQRVCMRRK